RCARLGRPWRQRAPATDIIVEIDAVSGLRSWTTVLFVPADRPELLAKAQTRGADAILVDLEDGVAAEAKDTARVGLREVLAAGALSGPSGVAVRINAVGEGA